MPSRPGDRASGRQLQLLIARAYGISLSLRPQFLVGGDPTSLTKRFDIEASAGREVDADEVSLMLRDFLAERFKLRLRREMRELPVYEVVRVREDQLGPELRSSPHDCRALNQALRAKGEWSVEALAELRNPHGGLACRGDGSRPPPSAFRNKSSGKLEVLFQYAEGSTHVPAAGMPLRSSARLGDPKPPSARNLSSASSAPSGGCL